MIDSYMPLTVSQSPGFKHQTPFFCLLSNSHFEWFCSKPMELKYKWKLVMCISLALTLDIRIRKMLSSNKVDQDTYPSVQWHPRPYSRKIKQRKGIQSFWWLQQRVSSLVKKRDFFLTIIEKLNMRIYLHTFTFLASLLNIWTTFAYVSPRVAQFVCFRRSSVYLFFFFVERNDLWELPEGEKAWENTSRLSCSVAVPSQLVWPIFELVFQRLCY